ncbi:ATP-binding cassette domain-containing protein, partial [Bifidobacterium sp. M0404]
MLSPDGHSSFDTANITLEFKDVCFSYNTADKDDERNTTLQNISFSAVPHQRTVIVGSSGSGKTTLLSLLEAFYRPDSGHILYNNVDSTDLNGPIGTKRVVLGSVCGFGCVLVRVWCWG